MLGDNDSLGNSNGTSRVVSNGTTSRSAEGSVLIASNGHHGNRASLDGTAEELNGSSQHGKKAARVGPPIYKSHDGEEVTRILIQALTDMGYHDAAHSVSRDSGYDLESPTVAALRSAVLDGAWPQVEELLTGAATGNEERQKGNGLVLAPGADRNVMRIWVRQQKFLELLERRETPRALLVLRSELTPLCGEQHHKLHFLSSLLMCQSPEDLKLKADWDGAQGRSRRILLSELSRCISPSVMLPESRLAELLDQVKDNQIVSCLFHTSDKVPSLYSDHLCDKDLFPRTVVLELDQHPGELWQVAFSPDGTKLASCGSDPDVYIWNSPSFDVLHKLDGGHTKGVGNLAWSPDNAMLVTCGVENTAKVWNVETGTCIRVLDRFDEPVSSCAWGADSKTFILGSFDKEKHLSQWNLQGERLFAFGKKHRAGGVAASPDGRWLATMDEQCHVYVYNMVKQEFEYELELPARPTSISISSDSHHLLVLKRDGEAQMIDLVTRESVATFLGATGGEFTIRSEFGGAHESFVISGSEDGHVCIWHKHSALPIERLSAHSPRCNAVSWNPKDPCMFASCGDDGKIKIWSNKQRLRSFAHPNGESRNSNGWRGIGVEVEEV